MVYGVIILSICIGALILYLILLKKAIRDINRDLVEKNADDTNTMLSVSFYDHSVCALANTLNEQLISLNEKRLRYENGDAELKKAVSNVVHDLRTPITAISGYLDLLDSESMSEDAARYLAVIRERIEALRSITEELFCYSVTASSPKPLVLEDVDICAAMEQSVAGYYSLLCEKNITPKIDLAKTPVVRLLDKQVLTRIFENIIHNAVKYSDGDLLISVEGNGTINFSNTAKALDEVSVGKLFDRFFTVESGRTSTGLGLSIAKLLTERMGGTIHATYHDTILSIIICF